MTPWNSDDEVFVVTNQEDCYAIEPKLIHHKTNAGRLLEHRSVETTRPS